MFKATHVNLVDCDAGLQINGEDYEKCFPIVDLNEESYFTDFLRSDDGQEKRYWSNAEDEPYNQAKHEIEGELASYTNDGFYKSFSKDTMVE